MQVSFDTCLLFWNTEWSFLTHAHLFWYIQASFEICRSLLTRVFSFEIYKKTVCTKKTVRTKKATRACRKNAFSKTSVFVWKEPYFVEHYLPHQNTTMEPHFFKRGEFLHPFFCEKSRVSWSVYQRDYLLKSQWVCNLTFNPRVEWSERGLQHALFAASEHHNGPHFTSKEACSYIARALSLLE